MYVYRVIIMKPSRRTHIVPLDSKRQKTKCGQTIKNVIVTDVPPDKSLSKESPKKWNIWCYILGNRPRWKTNNGLTRDIAEEAVHLKSPVAGILLVNYEVIGKLSRRGIRLAALYLITSNKRYSPPLLFPLPFFSSPPPFFSSPSPSPSLFSLLRSSLPRVRFTSLSLRRTFSLSFSACR